MKKTLLIIIAFVAALTGTATDRFYIEDFIMMPGETRTVSIMLDNDGEYTAFQTDIYLSHGLTVEQEDGDYIFDLTSRKARDHNIASQLQQNGCIRIMSYSPSVKTYSGNSGALVTFNVIASADFSGPATISLKTTLFTTTSGGEISFADETCTVTCPDLNMSGDVNCDGVVDINDLAMLIDIMLGANNLFYSAENADCDNNGTIDIADVTALAFLPIQPKIPIFLFFSVNIHKSYFKEI